MTRRRPSRRALAVAVVGLVVACLVAGTAVLAVRALPQDDPGSSAVVVRTAAPDPDWKLVQGDSGEQGWVRVAVLAAARPPGEVGRVRLGVYTVDLRAAPDDRAETVGTLTLQY